MTIDEIAEARRNVQEIEPFKSIFPRLQRVRRLQVQGVDWVRGVARWLPYDVVGIIAAYACGPDGSTPRSYAPILWSSVPSWGSEPTELEKSILDFWPTTWGQMSLMNLLALQVQPSDKPTN